MKIAISGTSGTGKTTLARALATALSVPLFEENFSAVVEAAMRYNDVQGDEGENRRMLQRKALSSYKSTCDLWLNHRKQLSLSHSGYVADRCGFDILCRWITAHVPFDTTATLRQLISHCRMESREYDLIVIPPLTDWSMRPGKNERGLKRRYGLQNKLHSHSTLIGLIQQISTGPYLLLGSESPESDTTEGRLHEVLSALSKLHI